MKVVVKDTKELQLECLRRFMMKMGFELVYTDKSVFFRNRKNPDHRVGFNTAVRDYNQKGGLEFVLDKVNLQQSGYEIQCTNHFVKFDRRVRHARYIWFLENLNEIA